jgi:hypothetical protein
MKTLNDLIEARLLQYAAETEARNAALIAQCEAALLKQNLHTLVHQAVRLTAELETETVFLRVAHGGKLAEFTYRRINDGDLFAFFQGGSYVQGRLRGGVVIDRLEVFILDRLAGVAS